MSHAELIRQITGGSLIQEVDFLPLIQFICSGGRETGFCKPSLPFRTVQLQSSTRIPIP